MGTLNAPLFGLAPGGVYLAATCYHLRGALLPHHFTLTGRKSGGIFSAALAVGSRLPGVTWHPAQWSPDFPPAISEDISSDCPADSHRQGYYLSRRRCRTDRWWLLPQGRRSVGHARQPVDVVAGQTGDLRRERDGRFCRQLGAQDREDPHRLGSGHRTNLDDTGNEQHEFPL